MLSAQANDVSYRKAQLRRLQEEVIELEDVNTGVSIADLGLNDYVTTASMASLPTCFIREQTGHISDVVLARYIRPVEKRKIPSLL